MSKEVLVLVSDKSASNSAKVSGIYRYAKLSDWKVHVVETSANPANINALLKLWNPDGCILESGAHKESHSIFSSFTGVKTVFLDTDTRRQSKKNLATVTHDSEDDGVLAAKELLSIGRKSFAYIAYPGNLFWSREREASFLKTLRLNGVYQISRLHPKSSREDKIGLTQEILNFIATLKPGCGIFAANDYIASIILSVARLSKRTVPDDLAVLGVDNNESLCTNTTPTLSSIAPDFELGGYLAAELLERMFKRKNSVQLPTAKFGPIALIRRSSTFLPSVYRGITLTIMTMIRDSEGRLSPSEIFSKLACSRRTAELHFRKSTGKSILETINEIRFTTACLLLKQRRWSIAAIAERVGYASTIAFDRFFKSRSGQSPLRWQQKNINSYRTN